MSSMQIYVVEHSILVSLPLVLNARLDRVLWCAVRLIGQISKHVSVKTYARHATLASSCSAAYLL